MNEHFAVSPDWRWYILIYFFLAGIAGGAYVIGTLLRLAGGPRDRAAERVAFLVALPAVAICPVLLTLDLGSPARFWHMLVNTTPGGGGLNLRPESPMSVGVWALSLFAVFALISFLGQVVRAARRWCHTEAGRPSSNSTRIVAMAPAFAGSLNVAPASA